MDQASLLIAMYRHCGIPARYVVGTVELTSEQARNWAGSFDRVEDAALAYMYGGIPLSQSFAAGGGKLRALRIEHVWAEAWLSRDRYMGAAENYPPCDYDPATPHKCARAWFALDPSFKEYDIIAPPDIVSEMGFDPETTAQQIAAGISVDEATGAISGIDPTELEKVSATLAQAAEDYVAANPDKETASDFIGGKKIKTVNYKILTNRLKLPLVNEIERFAAAPPQYKYFFSFRIVAAEGTKISGSQAGMPEDIDGMPEYKESLAALASKRVTLSYGPSTAADEAHINNLAAQDPPPSTLSAYLLKVKPQLLVDGQLVKQGSAVSLGAKQKAIARILYPSLSTMSDFRFVKELDAGSYYAIGILNGVPTKNYFDKKGIDFELLKSKLESGSDIYKDEALGEILNTLIISYFAKFKQNTNKIASMSEIYYHSTPSIGWAHTFMSRDSMFGVTKSVKTTDMIIDVVDRIITLSYDGDFEKLKIFHQTEGALGSFWEGNIFSEMIPDVSNPISTVHLMMEAAILGQTIYTLNKDTYSTLMPYITGLGDDTRKHIIDAILAGYEVCIHSAPITRGSWRGFGYSVIDPVMKTGSYNIEGGAKGGGTGFDTSAQTLSPFSSAFLVNSANTPIQAASLLSKEKVLIDIIVTILSQYIILWICSMHDGKSIDMNKCSDCCIYADCGLFWSIILMIIGVVTALSPLKPVGILLIISALSAMYYYYKMDDVCASLKNDDKSTCVCKQKKNDS